MSQDLNNFLEEITDKFSDLFVETFIVRYKLLFPDKKIKNQKIIIDMLINKINTKFNIKNL